jgi:hypothetical protein
MADASTDGWAAEELGQAELGDQRLPALPCPWLPFTVTWLGRDLPASAGSPASNRALPGTQREASAARLAAYAGHLGSGFYIFNSWQT